MLKGSNKKKKLWKKKLKKNKSFFLYQVLPKFKVQLVPFSESYKRSSLIFSNHFIFVLCLWQSQYTPTHTHTLNRLVVEKNSGKTLEKFEKLREEKIVFVCIPSSYEPAPIFFYFLPLKYLSLFSLSVCVCVIVF